MKRFRTLVIAFAGAVILFGLYRYTSERSAQHSVLYRSGIYSLGSSDVALINGESVVQGPAGASDTVTTRVFGNEAYGDIDADGRTDVAFLLTQETGGSGLFYYVAVALGSDGQRHALKPLFLGDRIAPQSTQLEDGLVTVNYADRKPGESYAAQPSVGVNRTFRVTNGVLTEVGQQ